MYLGPCSLDQLNINPCKLMLLLAIAVGSALGGLARYLLGNVVQRWAGDAFPLHTLLINITGSFLIGFLYRYGADSAGLSPEWRGFLMIGFCGGYTTFSAFSLETVRLIETGAVGRAMAYAVLSVVLSVGAAAVGMMAARR